MEYLFFGGLSFFFKLINFWILAQLPYVIKEINLTDTGMHAEDIVQLIAPNQTINLSFGLTYPKEYGLLLVYLNFIPFIYLFILRVMQNSISSDREVIIDSFRENDILKEQLPLNGDINDKHKNGDELWFSIKLHKPLIIEERDYPMILARPKDAKWFRIFKENVSHMRLVSDPSSLSEKIHNIDEYEFVDWVIIK